MFGPEVEAEARRHAIDAYPEEACGLVVSDGPRVRYVRVNNIAPNPRESFAMPLRVWARHQIRAVVHSHPDKSADDGPSASDMRQQIATALPWGLTCTDGVAASPVIWWGDMLPVPDLVGRPFRHGPSGSDGAGDCYALIRDWYRVERGIVLREFPRDVEWWNNGADLYRQGFGDAGFRRLDTDREQPQPGDVFLAQVRSPVPNHGGIYLGSGLVLHQLSNRLSRREPVGPWAKMITHWLRYEGG